MSVDPVVTYRHVYKTALVGYHEECNYLNKTMLLSRVDKIAC